ncbi:hypothetical protein C0J52_23193 [Blattella germanica]|nr:hypothetical protein C0J52_23193 [Blattella germanica]
MANFCNCAEPGCEAEELDTNLAALTSEMPDLEWLTATFTEAIQSACGKTFKILNSERKSIKNKSVPWWTDCLPIIRRE